MRPSEIHVLDDVMTEARKHGDQIEPIEPGTVAVTQPDGKKTLVYKTMGRVHGAPNLSPEEVEAMVADVRDLREALKKQA